MLQSFFRNYCVDELLPGLLSYKQSLMEVEEVTIEPLPTMGLSLSFISLAIRLATADSMLNRKELEMIYSVIGVNDRLRAELKSWIVAAAEDALPLSTYTKRINILYGQDRILIEDIFCQLLQVAAADDWINKVEWQRLVHIGYQLEITYVRILTLTEKILVPTEQSLNRLLSLDENVELHKVKSTYYRIAKLLHPDKIAHTSIATPLHPIYAKRFQLIQGHFNALKIMSD